MISIDRQQILNRYDTLSEALKEAGFSPFNTKVIYQVGGEQHLTDDKILKISELVGYVLFGFIHPEDLAKEIKNEIGLNQPIAEAIAAEIDRKIFAPVRTDLEKVYAPPSEQILDLREKIAEKPAEEKPTGPVAAAPAAPVTAPPAPAEATAVVEEPKIVSVEEKPKPEEIQPPKIEPVQEPPAVAEAEPFIIHKEAEFKPVSETKKSLGGLFSFLKKKEEGEKSKEEPVKAQVKIGGKPLEAEPQKVTKPVEPPKIKVVHYTQFQPAASPFPTEVKSPENLPVAEEKPQPPQPTPSPVEKKEEKIEKKEEPVLDLRKPAEPPKPTLAKPEEEMIDLGSFK